jgi:energy-coupling factor transporter ATP-binding protein EcfA2
MKIINLKAENVKKIKAIDITPTDSTVVISGKNGQGKSSILDSILFALGGKDALKDTPKPVRDGEDHASVEVDLGDYKVVRTWNEQGTTRLEVFSKDGAKFGSPQTLLDEIVGRIAFDPLAFANMKSEDQKAVLLDVLGLTDKVTELQVEYKGKFEERTLVGRDLKTAEGHLNSIEVPENAPEAPIDTVKVVAELDKAKEQNQTITETEDALEEAKTEVKELETALKEAKASVLAAEKALKGKKKIDTTPLTEKLASAAELNRAYETVEARKKAANMVQTHKTIQKELTDELAAIMARKEALITSVKLPIEGLDIDSEGVTFKAIPFSQLSSAEQLKVSLAIAMSMNPKLRVMRIMDGSLLDSDNMKVIKEMATAEDYQVWIERVEDNGQVGILIENGEVKN